MSTPQIWNPGDVITSDKLNSMEERVRSAVENTNNNSNSITTLEHRLDNLTKSTAGALIITDETYNTESIEIAADKKGACFSELSLKGKEDENNVGGLRGFDCLIIIDDTKANKYFYNKTTETQDMLTFDVNWEESSTWNTYYMLSSNAEEIYTVQETYWQNDVEQSSGPFKGIYRPQNQKTMAIINFARTNEWRQAYYEDKDTMQDRKFAIGHYTEEGGTFTQYSRDTCALFIKDTRFNDLNEFKLYIHNNPIYLYARFSDDKCSFPNFLTNNLKRYYTFNITDSNSNYHGIGTTKLIDILKDDYSFDFVTGEFKIDGERVEIIDDALSESLDKYNWLLTLSAENDLTITYNADIEQYITAKILEILSQGS